MFWPNQPSSDVQVIVMKDSAAHCNAVQQERPLSQQPVHLKMASYAKTYSDNKEKMTREH
jgi:hypothetical protein